MMNSDIFNSRLQAISNDYEAMKTETRNANIRRGHIEHLVEIQQQQLNQIESMLTTQWQGTLVQRVQAELMELRRKAGEAANDTPIEVEPVEDTIKALLKRVGG